MQVNKRDIYLPVAELVVSVEDFGSDDADAGLDVDGVEGLALKRNG